MKQLLSIAGSDSSGGAGIQADLKTFSALGTYGMSVITAITVQNTQGVQGVQDIRPDIIVGQIKAVFEDIRVDGVKIGMVSCVDTIEAIGHTLAPRKSAPVVLDPIMISKSGYRLLSPDALETLLKQLIPLASMVTPNIPETELMTGMTIQTTADMEMAARQLHNLGVPMVLIKGGHRVSDTTDVLFDGSTFHHFPGKKISTPHTHGTGCTLSAAIAAFLAKEASPAEAVALAKKYVTQCITSALDIGRGAGPLNHFSQLYRNAGLK